MNDESYIQDPIITNCKDNKKGVLTFFMTILGLISIVMGFLIYARSNPTGTVFGLKMSDVNSSVSKIFSNMFSFNIFSSNDNSKTVDTKVVYISLGENKYISEDGSIRALFEGTVNHVEEVSQDNYMVVLSYDNGVSASYYNLVDVSVLPHDRIDTNDILGSYEDSFNAVFFKDNKPITYEQI